MPPADLTTGSACCPRSFSALGDQLVMQAWSSYGVEWPVIYHFLGVRPNIPEREISVLPDLPPEWPTLSAQNIRVADSTMKASATQTLVCDCWRVQTG
jgi:hypothetical protein